MKLFYVTFLQLLMCHSYMFDREANIVEKANVSNIFKAFGYSPVCVASALASCECSSNSDCPILPNEIATFLRVLKSGKRLVVDNLNNSSSPLVDIVNQMEEIDEISIKGAEGFSMMKAFLQDAKDSTTCLKDNSNSTSNHLQDIKSALLTNSKIASESLQECKAAQKINSVSQINLLEEFKSAIDNISSLISKNETDFLIEFQTTMNDNLNPFRDGIEELILANQNYLINITFLISDLQTALKNSLNYIEESQKETKRDIEKVLLAINHSHTEMKTTILDNSGNITNSIEEFREILLRKQSKDESSLHSKAKNCAEILLSGDVQSGVRTVYLNDNHVQVFCDQATDGGGWTVFQNRDALPNREKFERKWDEYVKGFGNITGEYWLGLDNLHALVSSTSMELRVDLEDYEGEKKWAKYGIFSVGDAPSKYKLTIGDYDGDAGDSMAYHNGMPFATYDNDETNCAEQFRGAWWYKSCSNSNLNGYQYVGKYFSYRDGITWYAFRGEQYALKKVSMKIRPKTK